jgi:GMP synthase-like glutamine amidotransferase
VRLANQAEYGWTRIELLSDSPLTRGVKKEFYSFSAHFDEVCSLPPGIKRLARSADCEIQACQLEDAPVFSIQFHPEKNIEDAKKTFADRRKKGTPKRLLHADESEKYYQPELGETLFRNFFRL